MKTLKNQQGFTLIEVVIALGVLAFGILSLMILQTSGIRGNTAANVITTGTNWASDQIERVITLDYDADDLDEGEHTSTSSDGSYTTTWTVTKDDPIPYTKKIAVVVVNNTDNENEQHTVEFEYIKPKV